MANVVSHDGKLVAMLGLEGNTIQQTREYVMTSLQTSSQFALVLRSRH
jgi:hypothetical protein